MQVFGAITTIIAGIVIIAAAGVVLYVVYRVRSIIMPIFQLASRMDEQELEAEITPKSVSAMTSVYLPKIQKDFPEFNYYEFKTKAENMMTSAFNAVTLSDITKLVNASSDLTAQIDNVIAHNRANGFYETYSGIVIHRTEIKNYKKDAGTCVITLQSSVGYKHYIKKSNGTVIEGSEDRMFQTKYDIDLMYVQDTEKVGGEALISNNCPNCGAPIKMLGVKSCPYCGSEVESINIRTWSINKLTEC